MINFEKKKTREQLHLWYRHDEMSCSMVVEHVNEIVVDQYLSSLSEYIDDVYYTISTQVVLFLSYLHKKFSKIE